MLSDIQKDEKIRKIKLVIRTFLENKNNTVEMVSAATNISKSSVQRYLNDEKYIKIIYEDDANEIINKIIKQLNKNKVEGLKKGGNNTTNNHTYRDDLGHFAKK